MDGHVTTPNPYVALRRERLGALVDLRSGIGLEIGPLDSPIATIPPFDVRYADVLDTEGLRQHYGNDPAVATERIVDVDFPLQTVDGMRTLAQAAAPCAPYRWAIASHVIEHVPDLVGWLADVAALLEDGGRLALVVPDRRFTFDAIRPATTVGQILQSHSLHETTPSERAVYDHFRSMVNASAASLWAGEAPQGMPRQHSFEVAASMRETALRGEYVDSHVWVFTPSEFVANLDDLVQLDLCVFTVEQVLPTQRDELEFIVLLRRLPRDTTAEGRARLLRDALADRGAYGNLDAPDAPDARDPGIGSGARALEVSELEAQLIQGKRVAMSRLRALRAWVVRRASD